MILIMPISSYPVPLILLFAIFVPMWLIFIRAINNLKKKGYRSERLETNRFFCPNCNMAVLRLGDGLCPECRVTPFRKISEEEFFKKVWNEDLEIWEN